MELKESRVEQSSSAKFPTEGILPKVETQATLFLTKYPKYDGRGVVVGIFDTGVDPGAPGLQVTSDGNAKIIDIVDCSGSGDVDTSTVREAIDGVLVGLTGRKLKLGKWNNPSGKYHIGFKRAYEIQPRGLTPRIKKERKEDQFDPKQREVINNLQREIAEWKKTENEPSKKDLEARLEVLTSLSYEDPGPVYDVVVFQDDAGIWRAVVDTKEDGDLTNSVPLADYHLFRQYATFSKEDLLNYCVNIYNDGNLCCICADAGSHGTHVAGIVGGYFKDQPELNGIAPGVQIVSIKIGDTRLGSMETGTSLVRGIIAAQRARCDIINISYGEPVTRADVGRIVELFSQMVTKHRIIMVASAGNNGPCLSTVGAPGGTTSHAIGVAAMVSPQMMSVEYSLREKLPATQFTWSSRGPTDDGALGVSVSAPGGAFSPVPNWTLQKTQQMNGTSMSSPNACGNIVLILSGLKALKLKYSPQSIKRAIENTANFNEALDHFTQGYGCIQSLAAFEYAKTYATETDFFVSLKTSEGTRGLYLRNASDLSEKDVSVLVDPMFHKDYDNLERIKFEKRLILRSTVPWVKTPDYLVLPNEQRSFRILVDPSKLVAASEGGGGIAHYGEVQLIDSQCVEAGPLARFPCTVIKPIILPEGEHTKVYDDLKFTPGLVRRFFFAVPQGATWAKVKVKATDVYPKRLFVYQRLLVLQQQSLKTACNESYLWLEGDDTHTERFEVVAGHTQEVVLAQYWSALGDSGSLSLEVEFHGILMEVQGQSVQLTSSECLVTRMLFPLRSEKVAPKAVLAVVKKRILPASSVTTPFHPQRDCLPDGRQIYGCVNTYNFHLTEGATVLTRLVGFDGLLYDSPHESQFWMIYDENKQFLFCGDFCPEAVSISKKGKYTVRVLFRHDNTETLNQVKSLSLLLERHLPKDKQITLSLYRSMQDALVSGTKFPAKTQYFKGQTDVVVVGPPPDSKLPKELEAGDVLSGYIIYRNLEEGENVPDGVPQKGLSKPVGGYLIDFLPTVAPAPKKAPLQSNAIDETKSARENYELSMKQNTADFISMLITKKKLDFAKVLLDDSLKQYADFLPLLEANMAYYLKDAETTKNYVSVIRAANLIISQINTNELVQFYGLNHDNAESDIVKHHDKLKKTLIKALQTKTEAQLDSYLANPSKEFKEGFLQTTTELNKWLKSTETSLKIQVYQEKLKENLGAALKILKKKLEGENSDEATNLLIALFEELKWDHWAQNKKIWMLIQYPTDFLLF